MTITEYDISAPAVPDLSGLAPLHPDLPHAVVYTNPACPNCDRIKRRTAAKGYPLISVSLADHPEAYDFVVELGARQAPVTLVHNVFTTPVWFAGALPDQVSHLVAGTAERLAHLHNAGAVDADEFAAALTGLIDAEAKVPSVDPGTFAHMAAGLMAPIRSQPARVSAPNPLRAERAQNPAVLTGTVAGPVAA